MARTGEREKIWPLFDHLESCRMKLLSAERIESLAGADVRDPLAGIRLQRRQDVAPLLRLLPTVIGDLRPAKDRTRQERNPTRRQPAYVRDSCGDSFRCPTLADDKVSLMRNATISPETNVNPATIQNAPARPSMSAVTPAINAPIA